jgi:aspartyl-tRNA(Asn)/glutamyl-tRNA(Gln) amidotransferase subunit C
MKTGYLSEGKNESRSRRRGTSFSGAFAASNAAANVAPNIATNVAPKLAPKLAPKASVSMRRKVINRGGVGQETNVVRCGASQASIPGKSMSVTGDTIREIAQLARLRVDDNELPALTGSFNAILDLFEQLQAAPTDGVEPMANALDARQTLREDLVTEENQREQLQAVAPLVENGLYLVPRVVE